MIVISDTSCLCYLAILDVADLLPRLYGTVAIPQAVYSELIEGSVSIPAVASLLRCSWLEVHQVKDSPLHRKLLLRIDRGEAAALALAEELKADLVLVDDGPGRKAAIELGVLFTGTLGVLAASNNAGLIGEIRPLVTRLLQDTNFRCSPAVVAKLLAQAGESP